MQEATGTSTIGTITFKFSYFCGILFRLLHPTNVAVIQEVYDGEFSQQYFVLELERALDAECEIIVIEPTQLGDETARWISVGNYLHKIAVVSGFGAIAAGNFLLILLLLCYTNLFVIFVGLLWPDNPLICAPLGAFSLLCTGLYTASWQFDNCVKYQVCSDNV